MAAPMRILTGGMAIGPVRDYAVGMLGNFLRRFFRPRTPTAFEVLAERVRASRLEAARLAAYATAGARRLQELEASQRQWERRAKLAEERGLADLAEAARDAAREDAERVAVGRQQLAEIQEDAAAAQEIVAGMRAELERVVVSARGYGVRLPAVETDDGAAERIARAEALEAEQFDGLDDAMERDWLDRAFERLERPALQ